MSVHDPERNATAGTGPVIVLAEVTLSRRMVAALLDAVTIGSLAFVLSVITFGCYIRITGDDFDGPPRYDATADWFSLALLGFFALLLSTCEIGFAASLGKAAVGVCIEGTNLFVRWFVKWLPLAVFAVIAWVGYGYMESNRRDYNMQLTLPFHQRMLWLVALLPTVIAVLLTVAAVLRQRLLHDCLAGTALVRRSCTSNLRAFTPIIPDLADPPGYGTRTNRKVGKRASDTEK